MSNTEQTLSIIKPDAVERNLDSEIKEIFKKVVPDWIKFDFQLFAKYLGIMVGPKAGSVEWRFAKHKFTEILRHIKQSGQSAIVTSILINVYAISVLEFLAQVKIPSQQFLQFVINSIENVYNTPANTYNDLKFCWSIMGIKPCVRHSETHSNAVLDDMLRR